MFVQKQKSDIIGKYKLKKIDDRLNNIMRNCESIEYCFGSLIDSYFDIAEYTGVAIKYYCKTGYSSLDEDYGYNDICKFDYYAKECYERVSKIKEIVKLKFENVMNVEEMAALIESIDDKVYKNEFGIPKDYFIKEYKHNLFLETVCTYAKIGTCLEFDSDYKYDDEDNYHLIMDLHEAYVENSTEYLFRDGVKPQLEEEITDLVRLIHNKSVFKGKVFEKK